MSSRHVHRFLHKHVRITEGELGQLFARELGLTSNPTPWQELRKLVFLFADKLVREDGLTLWSTVNRRDIFMLNGRENDTALCAQAICFIKVCGLEKIQSGAGNDDPPERCSTFVLIRWLSPHPDSFERDAQYRPVCPGPLHVDNCLWQHSRAAAPRESLNMHHFRPQRQLFGTQEEDQNVLRRQEQHAWYGLILPENIDHVMNMCPVFKRNSSDVSEQNWLQTVTMY